MSKECDHKALYGKPMKQNQVKAPQEKKKNGIIRDYFYITH